MFEKNIDETLVFSILEFANVLKRKGDIITQREGITTQQWLILLLLAGDTNIPFIEKGSHKKALMASEIADALGVSRPNITNIVATLMDKGLVIQFEDPEDRRRKRLALTSAGIDILERLQPIRNYANTRLFESFLPEEKNDLLAYIKRCMSFLER
jgi:DNA-binding MarR family transcriptional regulator